MSIYPSTANISVTRREGRIELSDQILPLYVLDRLEHMPGLTGLFTAGIFSASLSTVSAAINSLAAVSLEDYVKVKVNYLKDVIQKTKMCFSFSHCTN